LKRNIINANLEIFCIYLLLKELKLIFIYNNFFINLIIYNWGLGIGDWGLGIGDWGFGPRPQTPNPKTQIPNPQSPFINFKNIFSKIYYFIINK
jgi:hypothetical protein